MFERMKAGWRLAKDGNMKDGDLAKVKVDGIEVLIIKDKVQIVNSESMNLDINGNDASLTVVSGTEALHNERTVKL